MRRLGLVRWSLFAVIAVAVPTLVRSVAYGRWATVFAAYVLVFGALAALCARTWGVGLVLATAVAFPAAHLLGMAPAWFWLVGLVGAAPFALSWRPMARFDRGAAILYGVLATGAGVSGALAYFYR